MDLRIYGTTFERERLTNRWLMSPHGTSFGKHPSGQIISGKTVWDEKSRQQVELFRTALDLK